MCKLVTLFTALFISVAIANAAELSVTSATVPVGATSAQMEVRLGKPGGEKVAAFQTDLLVDPGLGVSAQIGAAASAAGKQLSLADLGDGRKRLIVAGLNQNIIGDGVVVVLTITFRRDAVPGRWPIRLASANATDPSGRSFDLTTSDGSLTIGSSPSTGGNLTSKGTFAHIASGGSWKTVLYLLIEHRLMSLSESSS